MAIETRIKVQTFSDGRQRFLPEYRYTGRTSVLPWAPLEGVTFSLKEEDSQAAIALFLSKMAGSEPVETYYKAYP